MISRIVAIVCMLSFVGMFAFAQAPDAPTKVEGKGHSTSSGLQYWDIKVGTGPEATAGKTVSVHYTGWLTNGKKFDSSLDSGRPFNFELGAGRVIKGWDEGVAGMKVGGKRQLRIPSDLAYGPKGVPNVIPPNSILVFDVELLGVK
ncbi:MAG: FKBP-type peptidyl-prolyl cis-trans isomerase [Terriglobales bacterium]